MDDMRCIAACLPWITLRVSHRAHLRPQAPQPPMTFFNFIFKKKRYKDQGPVAHSYDLLVDFHDVEHKDLMSALVPL